MSMQVTASHAAHFHFVLLIHKRKDSSMTEVHSAFATYLVLIN